MLPDKFYFKYSTKLLFCSYEESRPALLGREAARYRQAAQERAARDRRPAEKFLAASGGEELAKYVRALRGKANIGGDRTSPGCVFRSRGHILCK